ncbi:N-acetylglucosamine kinase-like BadF-type ATPase [Mesorhizobium robiniae]|uniref:N-acetylglucosamine kinase-like BadF-type ATPase n=1 Tax=Mesorhizobium robiniae TaxID=559315 RepID=A0ABV2GSV2_9HYPH
MITVGIDIGGTKTHLRASDSAGMARDLVMPTADWRVRDWDRDAAALLENVRQLVDGGQVVALAVGAHGCDDASECEAFETALARRAACCVKVVNDAELLPAALGYERQIGLVAGTGSIAVCRDASLGMMVAGGWGWVIGDEGSAAGLVREAGRSISLHLDRGGSLDEPLVRLFFEAFEIRSAARIGSAVARQGGAAALGLHAPLVFAAHEQGSELAGKVIRDGARHLAELAMRLKHNGAAADIVVAGGGVIVSQQSLAAAFLAEIEAQSGGTLAASIFYGPPVEGACRMAKAMAEQWLAAPQ